MPRRRRLRPCSTPGCPNLATSRSRCADCTAKYDRDRGSPAARGYDSNWQRRRRAFVRRHPTCGKPGCTKRTTDVHHEPPRRELLAMGVPDPDAERYLRARCHAHHSSDTVAESNFGRST